MKQIIKDVLDDMKDSQVNLSSDGAREMISSLISSALKTNGTYHMTGEDEEDDFVDIDDSIEQMYKCSLCDESTMDVDYDYLAGTNHLKCELEVETEKTKIQTTSDSEVIESPPISRKDLVQQAYREITSDGLPQGGDLEALKLAEQLVDNMNEKYIYESPDGGKTIFRRPFSDYNPENKEEIDWTTKEPTGRKFNDYNNGQWDKKDEEG
tara:strand:+ start:322 stop:951 length:630 start_codon:yes stop_codon:yes gene_type:complete